MFRSRRSRLLLVALALLASQGTVTAQEVVRPRSGEPSDRPISFVVEEGFAIPEQLLLQWEDAEEVKDAKAVVLAIRGNASFLVEESKRFSQRPDVDKFMDKTRVIRRSETSAIVMPAIKAAALHDESYVRVLVDGEQIFDDLRIATVRVGNVETIVNALQPTPGALISSGEHFAVVDENKVDLDASYPHPDPGGEHYIDYAPNSESAEIREKIFGIGICGSACIRFALGPGLVNWTVTNPAALGFKVKPETSNTLISASYPQQAIDGIYNPYYGHDTAVKVPDSCTAETGASWIINCCCNSALALLGHRCRWVQPSSIGWPVL